MPKTRRSTKYAKPSEAQACMLIGTKVFTMSQGEMITMADFFADVAQMEAHPAQVRDVLRAIRSGRAGTS